MTTNPKPYSCDHAAASDALKNCDAIGIDTEFVRERTYFAHLCLIQVSAGGDTFIVDPLASGAVDDLLTDLAAKRWILHSGRQDIEILYQAIGRMPSDLFDTQIAAALCGMAPQIGYAGLVKTLFDVELSKSQTRADWSRRPLSPKMLDYAAEDVEFLHSAHEMLAEQLNAKGRLHWAEEDSKALMDPVLYEIDPTAAVSRLKAARNMRGAARRAAVALAEWRERQALASNRPRQWIIRDATLAAIAERRPAHVDELSRIDGLAPGTLRRSGKELIDLVRNAASGSDDYRPPRRPDERDKAALKAMQKTVSAIAGELGIAAEVVAPRKELAAIMSGERDVRALSGWRREIVGERILELVD